MISYEVLPILSYQDNYTWCIIHPKMRQCAIIDPSDAEPILHTLEHASLTLCAILITHHHSDHCAGLSKILAQHKVPVFGPARENIRGVDHPVKDNEQITLAPLELTLQAYETPGHTRGHTVYAANGDLFTGDALFTGGCGRIFEGTAKQMYHSLCRLATLPDASHIYCGHEYTQSNLRFAALVEPDNQALQERIIETEQLRATEQPTVPSTLAIEKDTNPFLRAHIPAITQSVSQHTGKSLRDPLAVFTALRQWKDNF